MATLRTAGNARPAAQLSRATGWPGVVALALALVVASCSTSDQDGAAASGVVESIAGQSVESAVIVTPTAVATTPAVPVEPPLMPTPPPLGSTPVPRAPESALEPTGSIDPRFANQYQPTGTTCRVNATGSTFPSVTVVAVEFVVPAAMYGFECRVFAFTDEPFNVQCDCIYPLLVQMSERTLLADRLDNLTDQLRTTDELAARSTLTSRSTSRIDSAIAWTFDLELDADAAHFDRPHNERRVFVDAAGFTVTGRDQVDDASIEYGTTLAALDELLASVEIDGPSWADTAYEPYEGGQRCADDTWSIIVPVGWFAFGCSSFNTSTEADVALQCECNGPLSLFATSASFDDAVQLTQITSDTQRVGVGNLAGRQIRTVEGLDSIGGEYDVGAVQTIVDLGTQRLVIIGARRYIHAAPGHSWEDTVVAMDSLLESLTIHDASDCHGDVGPARIAPGRGGAKELASEPQTSSASNEMLQPRTAISLTGCIERVDSTENVAGGLWLEATTRDGLHRGWLPTHAIARPKMGALCGALPADLGSWDNRIEGDFDGDGLVDTMHVRLGSPLEEGTGVPDPTEFGVALGNGTWFESVVPIGYNVETNNNLVLRDGQLDVLTPERLGNDAAVAATYAAGTSTVEYVLLDVDNCAMRVLLAWFQGTSGTRTAGLCTQSTPSGDQLRFYQSEVGSDGVTPVVDHEDVIWTGEPSEMTSPVHHNLGFSAVGARSWSTRCGPD